MEVLNENRVRVMIVALIFETIEKIDVFEVLNWFLEFQFSADNGMVVSWAVQRNQTNFHY